MRFFVPVLFLFAFFAACDSGQKKEASQRLVPASLRTNNDNIRQNRQPLSLGPDKLSEFGFFEGKLSDLVPGKGIVPYDLNMPLFSDYADKSRFVALPPEKVITVLDDGSLDFPVGTRLIKTFHYPAKNEAGRKLMETRVIEKTDKEWKALTYIWNDEQTEAFLEVAGGNIDVELEQDGVLQKVSYSVPDVNQCKTCHGRSNAVIPLGPKISQLNRDYTYPEGTTQNQLSYWKSKGLLDLRDEAAALGAFPDWNSAHANVSLAARAYLDANCGSCHHPEGSANTSGLFLTFDVSDRSKYGIMKKPVAAGKGSGGRLYAIVPGKPEESILVFRMESTDPGIMMPELGRSLPHKEGVALIRQWIAELESNAPSQ
ncbi:SO2930 family diheme c-type cytochrome [uncultured Imperialibacter sp.]|uniref:SO2930 family diheme c-type cytochrome n=1 Tax=uncultured Imperialibacter sp. TaxID=1672639 RepID=UPI0030D6F3FF|tara:strand:- start:6242 stop:7357 length:1116 start_codon:yes stop_codon:yes gene_type:complete